MENEEEEDEDIPIESKISKILSEKTIEIVILMVLALLFLIPLIGIDTWTDTYLLH